MANRIKSIRNIYDKFYAKSSKQFFLNVEFEGMRDTTCENRLHRLAASKSTF